MRATSKRRHRSLRCGRAVEALRGVFVPCARMAGHDGECVVCFVSRRASAA